MDIHKPKAAHSWREFAVEISTIICGILIALGLDQAVEQVREQKEVAETREALYAEIAENAMNAKVSIAEHACADAFREKTSAWLNGGAKPVLSGQPMFLALSSTVWDTVHNKGVAHMPVDEQLRLARYYEDVRLYNENETSLRQAALRTVSIFMLNRITPEQASRLAEDSTAAALLRQYQTRNAKQAIVSAVAMKIEPVPIPPDMRSRVEGYCRAAGLPVPPL